ncbi:MAG: hypothetical protein ACYSUP_15565 [Planctomycetota bacterium]|jgi:hypothetical protein
MGILAVFFSADGGAGLWISGRIFRLENVVRFDCQLKPYFL